MNLLLALHESSRDLKNDHDVTNVIIVLVIIVLVLVAFYFARRTP